MGLVKHVPVLAAWLALALGATTTIAVAMAERVQPRPSPDEVVRAYFSGLQELDADRSVAQIVPEMRPRVTAFVENGAGNVYRITGVAVERPSLMARWAGSSGAARNATVFLDITQADGMRWQATPRVELVYLDRWYLADAPLRPPG